MELATGMHRNGRTEDHRTAAADLIDVEEFFADPEFAVPSISSDGTRITYLAPHHGRLGHTMSARGGQR